ncbi:MAG: DUF3071 domain-containing protein [Actinobacteria bacterium]|uniref:Unannotated protein n=1 Tax=freshwater metagenome TaxID=449393 RepID=A0A6J7CN94_9ZZZZ|nr:DUF3071 domain-containing protein [Actinomycetota bacterium]
MEELSVIEVTRDGIIVVTRDGQRFSLALDDALRSKLGHSTPSTTAVTVSPKEIQSLLRSGLSVADVATQTGTSDEHVARFEAPIVAELAFVLERALAVPVVADDSDSSFGAEIGARISAQGGRIVRWQAYRTNDEWVVGARCLLGTIEEDATWAFDPRKMTLVPSNAAAVRISKSESIDAALFPPLRVVSPRPAARFDSGEFEPLPAPVIDVPTTEEPASVSAATSSIVIDMPVVETPAELNDSPRGIDDLTRRRGARKDAIASHPSTGSIPIITPDMLESPGDSPVAPDDVPATQLGETGKQPIPAAEVFTDPTPSRSKRQRAAMPTWDEIVFGARPDDE